MLFVTDVKEAVKLVVINTVNKRFKMEAIKCLRVHGVTVRERFNAPYAAELA
jgi:hypothetical protein